MKFKMDIKSILTNKKTLLLLICFLGLILRIYDLSNNPNGLYSDEASVGYNAYSILKTGADEHGVRMPIYFRAFGEYKHPVYIYSTVFSIAIFGLNEFAVRFPAVVIGVLTILLTYFLTKKLFDQRIALVASFLLAISPWHIQFSRVAFEAISLPFFFTLGVYLLLKSFEDGKYLILAAIVMGLTLYSYSIAKLFVPLFLFGFFVFFHEKMLRYKKEFIIAVVIFLLLLFPCLYSSFFEPMMELQIATNIRFDNKNPSLLVISNYLTHLSPQFLFIVGDENLRHNPLSVGQLYLFEYVLLVIGLIGLLLNKRKLDLLLVLWFFMAPIPASLTTNAIPHAIRTINALPMYQIISAYGLFRIYYYLKSGEKLWSLHKCLPQNHVRILVSTTLTIIAITNVGLYLHDYFVEYPIYSARDWGYGVRDVIKFAETFREKNQTVVVSRTLGTLSVAESPQAYILTLFYLKYDPVKYQQSGGKIEGYEICQSDIQECYKGQDKLYVITGLEPIYHKVLYEVNFSSGGVAARVVR
jgi:asparagine N-glycosylation enzyme membrane subunit Stt3